MNRRPTLLAAATLTAAAVLSLTACGGGDGDSKENDKIAGAESGDKKKETPSPTASDDGIDRPEIKLPKDVKNVFEGGETGDATKDAVLADHERMLNSVDEAITVDAKDHPALKFYSKGEGLVNSASYIESFYKAGTTWTGVTRYYDREVTFLKGGTAAVTYCGDATKAYSKNRKTGEVKRPPADAGDYVFYNDRMEKSPQGVWQSTGGVSEEGAKRCQP